MINKITNRIYYLPIEEHTDKAVLGYIKGDNISLMVDGGKSKKQADIFIEELNKIDLPYPSYVGITHWDLENCYGTNCINALSIATSNTSKKLNQIKDIDIIFEDKLSINLGNVSCHFINIDDSNWNGSIVVWIPEEKIIFLGDIHCEYNNKNKLSKLIQFLYETEFTFAITSSEGPFTRKELIGSLEKEYRQL